MADLEATDFLICCDTVIASGAQIFGKPTDRAQQLERLKSLNGGSHSVFSGVCLKYKNKVDLSSSFFFSKVHFRRDHFPLNQKSTSEKTKRNCWNGTSALETEWTKQEDTGFNQLEQCLSRASRAAIIMLWDCRCISSCEKLTCCWNRKIAFEIFNDYS